MFKKDLLRRLEIIFDFAKTTFDAPSEEFEQDTLFIEIAFARPRMSNKSGGLETAKVVGSLIVYSQDNRLAYGTFSKRIEQAPPAIKRPFFFYDIDTDDASSPARERNIHERRLSFVFLYESQYDPDKGQLTTLVVN